VTNICGVPWGQKKILFSFYLASFPLTHGEVPGSFHLPTACRFLATSGLSSLYLLLLFIYTASGVFFSPGGSGTWIQWDSAVGIATSWTTEGSEFESWYGQEFSVLHVVHNGFGAHPASYPVGTGGCVPGGKAARAGI
jgi:hypothetical protein